MAQTTLYPGESRPDVERLMRIWDRMDGRRRTVDVETDDPEYSGWRRMVVHIDCGLVKTHPAGPYGGRWECDPCGVSEDGRTVRLCVWSPFALQDQDGIDAELADMHLCQAL